jgi:hypothetical protein
MLRVGIVAEGKSEFFVLEEIMRAVHSDIDFVEIQPEFSAVRLPFGWKGVRAWCQENGRRLEVIMRGRGIDLLVIHTDCSMAHNAEAQHPCPPASTTAEALRRVVLYQWLGLQSQPLSLLLTNPSKSTDAWVVAALDPPYRKVSNIECEWDVENELVARGLLRKKEGAVKKSPLRYQPLAELVARQLPVVCTHCSQAARFVDEFRAAAAVALLTSSSKAPL